MRNPFLSPIPVVMFFFNKNGIIKKHNWYVIRSNPLIFGEPIFSEFHYLANFISVCAHEWASVATRIVYKKGFFTKGSIFIIYFKINK